MEFSFQGKKILTIINPQRTCAARVYYSWVCLSVCVSVQPLKCLFVLKSMLRAQRNNCGVFSETAPLQRSTTFCIVRLSHVSVRSAILTNPVTRIQRGLKVAFSYADTLGPGRIFYSKNIGVGVGWDTMRPQHAKMPISPVSD